MARNPSYTESMTRLIDEFAKLPGIGRKTAEKLAYHVLKAKPEDALGLAEAVRDVKENIFACSICHNLTEDDPCSICTDDSRDAGLICVVEQPKDLWALERTGQFNGRFHVLTGRIMPLEGIGAADLTIESLHQRVLDAAKTDTPLREVILATNPDFEGDGTALTIIEALADTGVPVTRLARGLPSGSSIEYASSAILTDALRGRTRIVADAT